MVRTQHPQNPELTERVLGHEPHLLDIARTIAASINHLPTQIADNPPCARIIGGFVRDAVMGIPSGDLDMQVYGVQPEVLLAHLQNQFPGRIEIWGKSFQCLRLCYLGDVTVDIAIPRTHVSCNRTLFMEADPSVTPAEGRRQSDFTVNSLAACPLSGEVFDYLGGLDDIRDGVLRVSDKEQMSFNPIGIYRGMATAARFGFKPDADSLLFMRDLADAFDYTKTEPRVFWPIFEKLLLRSTKPSKGFELLHALGLRYRHFRFLLDFPAHHRETRWKNALINLDRAAKHLDGSHLSDAHSVTVLLIAFLAPLLDSTAKSAGEVYGNRFTYTTPLLRIVRERMAFSAGEMHTIARFLTTLYLIQRYCTGSSRVITSAGSLDPKITERLLKLTPLPTPILVALLTIFEKNHALSARTIEELAVDLNPEDIQEEM